MPELMYGLTDLDDPTSFKPIKVDDTGAIAGAGGAGGGGDGAIVSGDNANVKARVATTTPGAADPGLIVRLVGGGDASAANQVTGNTSLANIDTKTPALAAGRVPVDGSGVTQPVSAAALPLPSGAATSAAQTTGNTSLASIDTKTPTLVSGREPVEARAELYTVQGAGIAAGTTSAAALPNVAGKLVLLYAPDTNVGTVYLGGAGVTVGGGLPLQPGSWTPYLPIANLNALFRIAAATTGYDVGYLVLG